ncbi:hypothetical protein [Buttiauxella izardii]|uniref:DUF1240 domain-containing protein n=1 Tax=Buttiauxella izardii TaxID=82991 RepID=A0A3A5JRU1_9ENTR|nr:hypothetical protein [Buttiauxella izardii]RJT22367.1 hypothetical protein D6029_12085 [Buttiauxella izardii]
MKKNSTSQWVIYKGACVFSIMIFMFFIYAIIFGGTFNELQSLIKHGDIIHIYSQSIACACGIPIFTCAIFSAFRGLITKGTTPPKKLTSIGLIWGCISMAIAMAGVVGTILTPIGLMFSSYSNCPQERLTSYYVINLELCEHINPQNGNLE